MGDTGRDVGSCVRPMDGAEEMFYMAELPLVYSREELMVLGRK